MKGLTKISKIFTLSVPFGKFSSILRRTPNSAQGGRFCAKLCARRITESWHPYPIWRMTRSPDPNHPRTAAEKRVMIWRGRRLSGGLVGHLLQHYDVWKLLSLQQQLVSKGKQLQSYWHETFRSTWIMLLCQLQVAAPCNGRGRRFAVLDTCLIVIGLQ